MHKYLIIRLKKYISVIFTTIIFLSILSSNSFSKEDSPFSNTVEVEGSIKVNFSREKYIDKAFGDSFKLLMSEIVLSRDLHEIKNIKLNVIKDLISSFQILEESYRNDQYKAIFRVFYNEIKVKKFLGKKNISFSQPENISAVFFPMLFINEEIQDFEDNFFYKQWSKFKLKNELINFVLPIEDLDDFSKIEEMKNNIGTIDVDHFVNKYNIINYAFALMDYQNQQLNVHLKTNFNNSKASKNTSYMLDDINNETELDLILKDLKTQITDIWREENVVNLAVPLSIQIKYQQKNLIELDKLKNTLQKINIIDNYYLNETNINHSIFKIYYYGNPKKLKLELAKFDYELRNDQGHWALYLND